MSDKAQTPTGVFVRLPLSEEQRQVMYDYVAGDVSMETAILAIGTPVAGGELEVEGYVRPDWREGWTMVNGTDCGNILSDHKLDAFSQALCDYDKAQAALAAAQAEIVRLRRALQEIHDTGHDLPEFMRVEMIIAEAEKALKGPEA